MEIKTVDSRGRLHLGKEFAGMSFFFQQVSETKIVLDLAVVVKAEEFQQAKTTLGSTPERAEAEPVAHAQEVELKAPPSADLDEDKEEEDPVPRVQAVDTEVQPEVIENVPSPPQMKKKSSKPSVDLPPLNITPEQQRIMAGAVKAFFKYLKRFKPITIGTISAALATAAGQMQTLYFREYNLDWDEEGISTNKILKELRSEGLWVEKKPLMEEVVEFFKTMKARLEAEGVDMSMQREVSDETKGLIESVREVFSESKSLQEAMDKLNELGIRTRTGLPWNDGNFKSFCYRYFDKSEMPPSIKRKETEENH